MVWNVKYTILNIKRDFVYCIKESIMKKKGNDIIEENVRSTKYSFTRDEFTKEIKFLLLTIALKLKF